MTVDYPPSPQILKKVFEAIIGALATSDKVEGPSRASRLVLDLVATQLHGKDLTDIWDIPNTIKVTRDYKVELLLKLRIVEIGLGPQKMMGQFKNETSM